MLIILTKSFIVCGYPMLYESFGHKASSCFTWFKLIAFLSFISDHRESPRPSCYDCEYVKLGQLYLNFADDMLPLSSFLLEMYISCNWIEQLFLTATFRFDGS